jgi:NADPH2:quinone reductase
MKAAFFETTGAPDVIRHNDLPTPEPGTGQVRVRVLAASVNPIDTYIRSGLAPMPTPPPFVTGRDFAGTVDAVGPGVTKVKVGDMVWGANQGMPGRSGSCADYLVSGEDWVYPAPLGIDPKTVAAVALTGITAHLGLFQRANLKPGETVFVNGGTGGVGSLVVQMAKAVGAKAVTTAGTVEKVELARDFGADAVINYKTDDVAAAVKAATDGRGVDVWYETLPPADLDRTIDLVAPNGRIVVMAGRQARPTFPNGPFYVKGLSMFGFAMFNFPPEALRKAADDINRWLKDGKLRAIIGKVLPLAEVADAHRLQEENTLHKAGTLMGKIVILPAM